MDIDEFVGWLEGRDRDDLEAMVRALDSTAETPGGALGWLRATHEVEGVLRRSGQCRLAGAAAHRAMTAALEACAAAGLGEPDRRVVVRLARAAGDAALAVVTGVRSASSDLLLRPFFGAMVLSAP